MRKNNLDLFSCDKAIKFMTPFDKNHKNNTLLNLVNISEVCNIRKPPTHGENRLGKTQNFPTSFSKDMIFFENRVF